MQKIFFIVNDKFGILKLKNILKINCHECPGRPWYFLDIKSTYNTQGFFLMQKMYTTYILEETKLHKCKPPDSPILTNQILLPNENSGSIDAPRYH